MARTRRLVARVPEDLEAAARAQSPELAELPVSSLVRAGLAVLAGHSLADALAIAREAVQAPGPKPQKVAA
jgi:hypothetical protein